MIFRIPSKPKPFYDSINSNMQDGIFQDRQTGQYEKKTKLAIFGMLGKYSVEIWIKRIVTTDVLDLLGEAFERWPLILPAVKRYFSSNGRDLPCPCEAEKSGKLGHKQAFRQARR